MKYKLYFSIAALIICSATFSQAKRFTYYFNQEFNNCDSITAVYVGIGVHDNGVLKFRCFNIVTKQLIMSTSFTDSSLSTYQGLFESYFNNGYKNTEGKYVNGMADGLWKSWDSLGYIIDSSVYNHGKILTASTFKYYGNNKLRSSLFIDSVKDTREDVMYDEDGNLTREEKMTKGTGYLKEYDSGRLKVYSEYVKWKLKKETRYKPDGTELTAADLREEQKQFAKKREEEVKELLKKMPEYPGGESAFNSYIGRRLVFTGSLASDIRIVQIVKFSFMLNEQGHAYDIKMLDYTNPDLETLIRGILERMPAWKMKGLKKFGPIVKGYNIH